MDSRTEILTNAREKLGFSGIRNIKDLGVMKQDTLERKLRMYGSKLTTKNLASIYMSWLAENLGESSSWDDKGQPATKMCDFLVLYTNCRGPDALAIWNEIVLDARNRNAAMMPQRGRLTSRAPVVERAIIHALFPSSGRRGAISAGEVATTRQQPRLVHQTMNPNSNDRFSTSSSRAVASRHGYTCSRCSEPGHVSANCPSRARRRVQKTPPAGYVCNCGSIRHLKRDCPTPSTEVSQNPGGERLNTGEQLNQSTHEENAYTATRLDLAGRGSFELPFHDPPHRTDEEGGDRTVIWREPTPTHGRLTPWSEDEMIQDQPANAVKQQETATEMQETVAERQETRADWISRLEADSFLAELKKEIEEENLSVPDQNNVGGSSFLTMEAEHVLGGSPPRKRIKRESPENEICETEDTKPCCEDTNEKRVFTVSCSSPLTSEPKPSIELYRTPKALDRDPPYDPAVVALFQHRENVWVNKPLRRSALDLWPTSTQGVDEEEPADEASL